MVYLKLFWSFLQIGLFSIGGGYAALPLIQEQIVDTNGWLSMTEFSDIITISQMTPGPIAINAATFVGIKVGGPFGAVIATLAFILPSVIIISILTWIYFKYRTMSGLKAALAGLRPAVVGLIASAGISIILLSFFKSGKITASLADINVFPIVIFALALFVLRKFKVNAIFVMIAAGVMGGIYYALM